VFTGGHAATNKIDQKSKFRGAVDKLFDQCRSGNDVRAKSIVEVFSKSSFFYFFGKVSVGRTDKLSFELKGLAITYSLKLTLLKNAE
jgi:hypothetical protein